MRPAKTNGREKGIDGCAGSPSSSACSNHVPVRAGVSLTESFWDTFLAMLKVGFLRGFFS